MVHACRSSRSSEHVRALRAPHKLEQMIAPLMQIENLGDRAALCWLDKPDVVVQVSGRLIQNYFYLKVEFVISSFEPRLLKIPGQIQRFREFGQQVAIAFPRSKCSQCNVVVQHQFTHVAGCMRQQHRFTERFSARSARHLRFLSIL